MSFLSQSAAFSNKAYRRKLVRVGTLPLLAGGVLGCVWALTAAAQQTGGQQTGSQSDGGFSAQLDLSQTLEWDSNPDLVVNGAEEVNARTNLTFALRSVTATDSFSLRLGAGLEFGDTSGSDLVQDPQIQLRYARDVGHANFNATLRYSESEISSLNTTPVSDADADAGTGTETETETEEPVFTSTSGTRQFTLYGLSGAFGVGGPVGMSYAFSRAEVDYTGTTDPSLLDQTTDTFSTAVIFRPNGQVTSGVTLRYTDLDVSGAAGTDRQTTRVGANVTVEVSPVLTAQAALGYGRIEESGATTGVEDGVDASFGLTYTQARSSVGLSFSSLVEPNGRRERLLASYSMELPRGSLSFQIGGTRSDNVSGINPLYGVNFVHELPTGRFSFGLKQEVSTNALLQDEINSRLNADYTYDINSLSSIRASMRLTDSNELGAGAIDSRRIDLSLTYRYGLTRDWNLISGVSHIRATSDSMAERSSNRVFVGMQRSFNWN